MIDRTEKMFQGRVKALSFWQPWASLIADGHKRYETRSWGTKYRGDLLICCSQKDTKQLRESARLLAKVYHLGTDYSVYSFLSCGKAIAIATLIDCLKITPKLISQQSEKEKDLGEWSFGRYAWQFDNVKRINPILVKGQLGLFEIDLQSQRINF